MNTLPDDYSDDFDEADSCNLYSEWASQLSPLARAALRREREGEIESRALHTMNTVSIEAALHRLDRIEAALNLLVERQTIKEWYSTAEVGRLLGKAEYTVREWCRQGRITAKKKPCGRGKGGEWLVSHEELTRLKNEGLLPFSSRP